MIARRLRIVPLLLALLLTACGTAQVEVTTTVLSPNEAEQQVSIRAEGMLGEALAAQLKPQETELEGWATEVVREQQGVRMVMKKRGSLQSVWDLPERMPAAANAAAQVDVTNSLLGREYRVVVKLPPVNAGEGMLGASGIGPDQMRQLQDMMAQSVTASWTINLPGDITETNADRKTAHGATWDLTVDRTRDGMELRIASREGPNVAALAGGGVVAVALGGLGWYAYAKGRRQGEGAEDDAGPQGPAPMA